MIIRAWKQSDEQGNLVSCEIKDEEACRFDVSYPNQYGMCLEFEDRLMAERVAYALSRAREAGKEDAKKELCQWLGVK